MVDFQKFMQVEKFFMCMHHSSNEENFLSPNIHVNTLFLRYLNINIMKEVVKDYKEVHMEEDSIYHLVIALQDIKQELSSIAESLHTLAYTPPDQGESFNGIEEKLRRISSFVEDLSLKK